MQYEFVPKANFVRIQPLAREDKLAYGLCNTKTSRNKSFLFADLSLESLVVFANLL